MKITPSGELEEYLQPIVGTVNTLKYSIPAKIGLIANNPLKGRFQTKLMTGIVIRS